MGAEIFYKKLDKKAILAKLELLSMNYKVWGLSFLVVVGAAVGASFLIKNNKSAEAAKNVQTVVNPKVEQAKATLAGNASISAKLTSLNSLEAMASKDKAALDALASYAKNASKESALIQLNALAALTRVGSDKAYNDIKEIFQAGDTATKGKIIELVGFYGKGKPEAVKTLQELRNTCPKELIAKIDNSINRIKNQ